MKTIDDRWNDLPEEVRATSTMFAGALEKYAQNILESLHQTGMPLGVAALVLKAALLKCECSLYYWNEVRPKDSQAEVDA